MSSSTVKIPSYYTHFVNGDECAALIDTRGVSSRLDQRWIRNAVSISAETITNRWQELPPRCTRYALLIDTSEACRNMVNVILSSAGMRGDLSAVFLESDEAFWASVPPTNICYNIETPTPCLRLWAPGMMAALLVEKWTEWKVGSGINAGGGDERVSLLDVGCGQGRNAIYIIQELCKREVPIDIVAIDKRSHLALRTARFAAAATDASVLLEKEVLSQGSPSGGNKNQTLFAVSALAAEYIQAAQYRHFCRLGTDPWRDSSTHDPMTHRLAPDAFDVVFFARNTLKRAFVQSLPLLAARAVTRASGAIICVESFHIDATHPEHASLKLVEGELTKLLTDAVDTRLWVVETVHESREQSEDDKPMLLSVVRISLRSPFPV
jgi:hypothetical protein